MTRKTIMKDFTDVLFVSTLMFIGLITVVLLTGKLVVLLVNP
jgi:hypothetical protein